MSKLYKQNSRKIFRKYPFLINPAAFIAFTVSPILIPTMLIIDNWDDVIHFYIELWEAIRFTGWK